MLLSWTRNHWRLEVSSALGKLPNKMIWKNVIHKQSLSCSSNTEAQNCDRVDTVLKMETVDGSASGGTEAQWTELAGHKLSTVRSGHSVLVVPWTTAPGCSKIP